MRARIVRMDEICMPGVLPDVFDSSAVYGELLACCGTPQRALCASEQGRLMPGFSQAAQQQKHLVLPTSHLAPRVDMQDMQNLYDFRPGLICRAFEYFRKL